MASPHLIGFDARLKAPTRRLGRALGLTGALEPVHEFGDGKSPTRVLRVAQRERPRGPITRHLIFKYGRAALLTREIECFEAIWPRVKATSLFTELLEPAATRAQLAAAPAEIGALAYRDAGTQAGADDASALGGRFAAALGDPTQAPWPDRCPKQIATGLAGLLDAPELRWGNALAGYYEGRWLPDVEAVFGAAHTRDGSSRLLAHPDFAAARFDDARTETGALDDWCRGRGAIRELRRSGLEVIGRWGGAIWARDEAVEPALRLKLVPEEALRDAVVDVRPGQLVDVWIRAEDVAATRHALYVERARAAAPSWPDAPATLQLGRWRAPNPLHIGADALEAVAEVRCGPAHGDLHPGNILLAGGVPLFIDYGLAEPEAPIGADIARLLGCFVRDALATTLDPPALIEAIAALLGLPGAEAIESSAARRAVGLLTPWRDAWLDVRPETPLAHHLLGFALIGLKWTEDDGRDAVRHRACLVLAALAARAALGGSDESEEGDAIDPFAEAIVGQSPDVIAVYRTHLRRAHAHVVPFFQRAGEAALLEEVFVQLELAPEALGARPERAKARCTLEELLAGEAGGGDRWLLLGDPGAGKSTLARRLAADLAQRAGERVCVYVPLAAWAEAAEAGVDPFDFAEQAARACPSRAGRSIDGLAEALRDAAGREPGRVWLLLDGFDEMAPGLLDATRARIEALADTFAQATVAVLSRPIGACALAGFHRARVSALDPPRQRALLERWLGRDRGRRVWAEVDRRPALRAVRASFYDWVLLSEHSEFAARSALSVLAEPESSRCYRSAAEVVAYAGTKDEIRAALDLLDGLRWGDWPPPGSGPELEAFILVNAQGWAWAGLAQAAPRFGEDDPLTEELEARVMACTAMDYWLLPDRLPPSELFDSDPETVDEAHELLAEHLVTRCIHAAGNLGTDTAFAWLIRRCFGRLSQRLLRFGLGDYRALYWWYAATSAALLGSAGLRPYIRDHGDRL